MRNLYDKGVKSLCTMTLCLTMSVGSVFPVSADNLTVLELSEETVQAMDAIWNQSEGIFIEDTSDSSGSTSKSQSVSTSGSQSGSTSGSQSGSTGSQSVSTSGSQSGSTSGSQSGSTSGSQSGSTGSQSESTSSQSGNTSSQSGSTSSQSGSTGSQSGSTGSQSESTSSQSGNTSSQSGSTGSQSGSTSQSESNQNSGATKTSSETGSSSGSGAVLAAASASSTTISTEGTYPYVIAGFEAIMARGVPASKTMGKHQYLYIGASRATKLSRSVSDSKTVFYTSPGASCMWYATSRHNKKPCTMAIYAYLAARPTGNVIIELGNNDPSNYANYIYIYKRLMATFPQAKFWFVDALPGSGPRKNGAKKNPRRVEFNNQLKAAFPSNCIGGFDYLIKRPGFKTTDGTHYTAATERVIYKYVMQKLGRNIRYSGKKVIG